MRPSSHQQPCSCCPWSADLDPLHLLALCSSPSRDAQPQLQDRLHLLGHAELCTTWSEVACRGGLLCCRLAAEQEGQELLSLAASGHTVAAGAEGSILFWDCRTGAQAAVFDDTHSEAVTQVLVGMLPALGSLSCKGHGCCSADCHMCGACQA